MTVAAFMDLALYDPQHGYYARAARRSGRAGDFFTSVDVGPLFGELLEVQIAEMAQLLEQYDVVECGASDGRLAADILRAAKRRDPAVYDALRLHLVEVSPSARAAQAATLDDVADRLVSSSAELPESFVGVLIANELLDAMPVHQVVMRDDGLRESYVRSAEASRSNGEAEGRPPSPGARDSSRAVFELLEGPLSTPALQAYLDALAITLEAGWRVEIHLCAVEWMREAARRLRRGFIVLIDYGHDARELY